MIFRNLIASTKRQKTSHLDLQEFANFYHLLLGILLMWVVRRWPYEAFQDAQTGARAH
jgi:hypothetical protein